MGTSGMFLSNSVHSLILLVKVDGKFEVEMTKKFNIEDNHQMNAL